MDEKRRHPRLRKVVTTIVRRSRPEGGQTVMEFRSLDLSEGGLFISVENMELFALGEELEILVDHGGRKYYEGKARVVRSARVFDRDGRQEESGFGLLFVDPSSEFRQMLAEELREVPATGANT